MTGKRTLQVNVRMSEEDLSLLKKAAQVAWPGAILTTSSMLLSLSKMKAQEILAAAKPKK